MIEPLTADVIDEAVRRVELRMARLRAAADELAGTVVELADADGDVLVTVTGAGLVSRITISDGALHHHDAGSLSASVTQTVTGAQRAAQDLATKLLPDGVS